MKRGEHAMIEILMQEFDLTEEQAQQAAEILQ